jgi:hypothetical protein
MRVTAYSIGIEGNVAEKSRRRYSRKMECSVETSLIFGDQDVIADEMSRASTRHGHEYVRTTVGSLLVDEMSSSDVTVAL